MDAKTITLKALVDKKRNRIIYVESEADFVDILLSFLTMPLGTFVRLTRNHTLITELGCIINLYGSVENIDTKYLRTEACKTMLLYPQNAAANHCKNLKLPIDDTDSVRYFFCGNCYCKHKILSHYKSARCDCGCTMTREQKLSGTVCKAGFVYDVTRFVISDELEVQPASSAFIFSLLSRHGIRDRGSLDERTFEIGADEVLNLLKFSSVSRTALTDILLKQTTIIGPEDFGQVGFVKREPTKDAPIHYVKISVKIIISKSKKIVCYAEGGHDFVDLLFSFLTVPLGHVFKERQGAGLKGCLRNLYKSVHGLDAQKSLISDHVKDILLNPKLASWFGFSDPLLGLVEDSSKKRTFYWGCNLLTTDDRKAHSTNDISYYTAMDPKSLRNEFTSSGIGFVRRPGMFTVTDDLNVTPISPMSGLSILDNLKVPYYDVEERIVLVGKEEAWSLLLAAFNDRSALTEVFLA